MNAIVTAGGEIQPDEPLYAVAQGGRKAMLEIGGKPMVQWVLDALSGCSSIERVFVVGLPPETSLDCAYPLVLLPDSGDMLTNIRRASAEVLVQDPVATYAIFCFGRYTRTASRDDRLVDLPG